MNVWFYQTSLLKVELQPRKIWKADVSSVSSLSERMMKG